MIILVCVLAAALAAVSAALAYQTWAWRDPLVRRRLTRLVVTPSDDPAFSGVLREVGRGRDGHVVFSDCEAVETRQKIAGDVIKAKSQIVSYQRVVSGAAG